jgi:hypothetical protein
MFIALTVMPAPGSAQRAARGQAPAGIHDLLHVASKVVDAGRSLSSGGPLGRPGGRHDALGRPT